MSRDDFLVALKRENIGTGLHYTAVHLHPYYMEHWGFPRGMFPNAEYYSDRAISLPLYPMMSDMDADDVIRVVPKVIAAYQKTDGKGPQA